MALFKSSGCSFRNSCKYDYNIVYFSVQILFTKGLKYTHHVFWKSFLKVTWPQLLEIIHTYRKITITKLFSWKQYVICSVYIYKLNSIYFYLFFSFFPRENYRRVNKSSHKAKESKRTVPVEPLLSISIYFHL